MQAIFLSDESPFYQSASLIDLGPLPREPYIDFVSRQFQKRKVRMNKKAPAVIWEFFQGHPHGVIKTASYLWNQVDEDKEMDEKQLLSISARCVADTVTSEVEFFLDRRQHYPPNAMAFLLALARRDEPLVSPYSREFQRETRLSSSELQQIVESLKDQGVIRVRKLDISSGRSPLEVSLHDPLEKIVCQLAGSMAWETQAAVEERVQHLLWRKLKVD
jgi:hypothetical protein